jgi:hypothetical protein
VKTQYEISANSIISSRSASFWLKDAVQSLADRDPIDAINDAEELVAVQQARMSELGFPYDCVPARVDLAAVAGISVPLAQLVSLCESAMNRPVHHMRGDLADIAGIARGLAQTMDRIRELDEAADPF